MGVDFLFPPRIFFVLTAGWKSHRTNHTQILIFASRKDRNGQEHSRVQHSSTPSLRHCPLTKYVLRTTELLA